MTLLFPDGRRKPLEKMSKLEVAHHILDELYPTHGHGQQSQDSQTALRQLLGPLRPLPPRIVRILLGLAIGTAGGLCFYNFKLPLPWMIGAMVFTTVASAAGLPLAFSDRICARSAGSRNLATRSANGRSAMPRSQSTRVT